MIRKYMSLILLGVLICATASGGEGLPSPLRDAKPQLQPLGTATLRWFGMRVYDTALFVQEAAYTTTGTAVLCIRYSVSIKHQRLQEKTLEEWRRLGKGDDVQRAQWITQLDALWPDVKAGDRLTAYRRGNGPTQFYFGDRLLGEIADPAFGPAFFAIWLDANCRYPKVRDGLMSARTDSEKGR